MSTTRLALIGAGIIGKTHIDRIQRHPDLTLAGIAAPDDGNGSGWAVACDRRWLAMAVQGLEAAGWF